MQHRHLWVAMAVGLFVAACASLLRPRGTGVRDASRARACGPDGSTSARVSATVPDGGDGGSPSFSATDFAEEGDCFVNVRETRHRVEMETLGLDVARFTVTRDFAPRFPAFPICMDVRLPGVEESVFESFAVQTDGSWRHGVLERDRRVRESSDRRDGPERQPWASVEWSKGDARLLMPTVVPSRAIQVRYTIWAYGALKRGERRWQYCADPNPDDHEVVVPEVSISDHDPDLAVRRGALSPGCVEIDKPALPRESLSGRYGTYRIGNRRWWWRLELVAPNSLSAGPLPPEDGPVVFVLDASRSMKPLGGLAPQIAIVKAYARDVPTAPVELLLTNRTADRVFGRFVPANVLDVALASVADAPLKNGSFLDRGAEAAAEALRAAGRPGRVILMTDGGLRSRFGRKAAIATLQRAPAGTVVHLVYPRLWRLGFGVHHRVPEGLDELSAALGGASYDVALDERDPSNAALPSALKKLVRPDRIESILAHDARSTQEWPNIEDGPTIESEILAGDPSTWEGISTQRPPERVSIAGWIWGKKVELRLASDPAFERILPRIVTSQAELVYCSTWPSHQSRALREAFLAPGLAFWVPGSGEAAFWSDTGDEPDCDDESMRGYGHGVHRAPPRTDLTPLARRALEPCGLAPGSKGTIRAKVEIRESEILDVTVEGLPDERRRCVEEALWSLDLPDGFDDGRERQEYSLAFEVVSTPPP